MPQPSFNKQRSQMSPFSNVQLAGGQLPSLIQSINTAQQGILQADAFEAARTDHADNMEQRAFERDNSELFHEFIQDLDPSSPDFEEQLGTMNPRAFRIPGMDNLIKLKLNERDQGLKRQDSQRKAFENEMDDMRKSLTGLPPGDMIEFNETIRTGDRKLIHSEALRLGAKSQDIKRRADEKKLAETIEGERRRAVISDAKSAKTLAATRRNTKRAQIVKDREDAESTLRKFDVHDAEALAFNEGKGEGKDARKPILQSARDKAILARDAAIEKLSKFDDETANPTPKTTKTTKTATTPAPPTAQTKKDGITSIVGSTKQ